MQLYQYVTDARRRPIANPNISTASDGKIVCMVRVNYSSLLVLA